MGQRYVPLQFTAGRRQPRQSPRPANTSIAPPGYYMLFIVNSAGVPSVAPILHVARPNSRRPKFPDPAAGGWTFNGSAAHERQRTVLTGATNFQRGDAIWPTSTDPRNMTIEFDASIGGGTGADGLTLFFADASRGASAASLGDEGGGLGFSGIPGDAIALDEYQGAGAPSTTSRASPTARVGKRTQRSALACDRQPGRTDPERHHAREGRQRGRHHDRLRRRRAGAQRAPRASGRRVSRLQCRHRRPEQPPRRLGCRCQRRDPRALDPERSA